MVKGIKRRVLKKGRIVVTRQGRFVRRLAREIIRELRPYCSRIRVAGSIRRKEKNPVDIDIILIPHNKDKIEKILMRKGRFVQGGEKKARFRIQGVNVELYYTKPEEFGATLLAYSSKTGAGIGLRMVAKRRGLKLNQYGLWRGKHRLAGKTEKSIYRGLGRKYKLPENR